MKDPEIEVKSKSKGERGIAFAELVIVLPLLLVTMFAAFDVGRMIYFNQVLTDLTREAGNLVSRGATPNETFFATFAADDPLDLQNGGGIIISRVSRRDAINDQPWIFEQDRAGANTTYASHVGIVNGPANIPNVTELAPGVTIMAVEIVHGFNPVFAFSRLGLDIYPTEIYDAAYF